MVLQSRCRPSTTDESTFQPHERKPCHCYDDESAFQHHECSLCRASIVTTMDRHSNLTSVSLVVHCYDDEPADYVMRLWMDSNDPNWQLTVWMHYSDWRCSRMRDFRPKSWRVFRMYSRLYSLKFFRPILWIRTLFSRTWYMRSIEPAYQVRKSSDYFIRCLILM